MRRARLAALFWRSRVHWQALLEPTDACFGVVLSPVEAAQHPHMRARDVYSERQGVLQAAPAPQHDGAAYEPGEACAPGTPRSRSWKAWASPARGPCGASAERVARGSLPRGPGYRCWSARTLAAA